MTDNEQYCFYRDHWLQHGCWNLYDACYLIFGVDPRYVTPGDQLDDEYREFYKLAHSNLNITLKTYGKDPINGEPTILPAVFIKWANEFGYSIPKQLEHFLKNDKRKKDTGKQVIKPNKSQKRIEIIGNEAKKMFKNQLCIEYRGKAKLRDHLCEKYIKLFTPATFNQAWKEAKKAGLVEVENPDQYKKQLSH